MKISSGRTLPRPTSGPHGNAKLAAFEDQQVRDVIAMQKRAGLKVVTDGELRRRSWMLELFLGWEGIGATRAGGGPIKWRSETGASSDMTEFRVDRPIKWAPEFDRPGVQVPKVRNRSGRESRPAVALRRSLFPGARRQAQPRCLQGPGGVLARSDRRVPTGDHDADRCGRDLHPDRRRLLRLSVRSGPPGSRVSRAATIP